MSRNQNLKAEIIHDDHEDRLRREFGDPDLGTEKQHEIFLRGIAHDVNNNLMAIVTACDQLQYRADAAGDPKGIAQSIRTHVKAVSSLMRDLLSNRNMDAPVMMDQHELKSFLTGILPSLSLVAGQNTQIEVGDFNIPPVNVNPLLLHRVLLQLIRNVSELDVDRPLAFIAARRHQQWCEVSVSDNGPGIQDLSLEQIFESGFTTKGGKKTRGYGLAAVAWAVKSWGGEYGIDHIAGDTGCRFWVRLPLAEAATRPARA
jgi:K+-sensing histidine kinase KdpD